MTAFHVSHLSREKHEVSGRAMESAALNLIRANCWSRVPLGVGFLQPCRTGHPFAASGCIKPSQKIEFVFSASPETNRREPRDFSVARPVICGPWQPALRVILMFFRSY